MRRAALLILIGMAGGCAAAPPLLVNAAGGREDCRVQAGGVDVNVRAPDGERLESLARAHHGRVTVEVESDASYKCVGAAVFVLQRAGFRKTTVRFGGETLR